MFKLLRCTYRFTACEAEGEDLVELEKSNVLLMGPTGSGTFDAFVECLICVSLVLVYFLVFMD